MTGSAIRKWAWVHKWTSLICTVFLLLLCVTGLPLIFGHEIDHLLHAEVEPAELPDGTPHADLDRVITAGLARAPGEVVQFVIWDREEPNLVGLSIAKTAEADPQNNRFIRMDARTGEFLDEPDFRRRFVYIMYRLHVDMFAGLPGKLFLGLMGFLFCASIVSGIVVYAPSMRKLDFGAMRRERPRIVRWLDLHNLVGIVLVVWTFVVGFTGVINTWADLILKAWQYGQLAEMTAVYKDAPLPTRFSSMQNAVTLARDKAPGMTPSFVAYPGTGFSSKAHYAIFMRGDAPLTSRLLKPVLIDAQTGAFTDSRELPWYVTAFLLSQPLHFGDYGGMPLKVLWALLDIATIIVLVTGLYLWIARRRPMLKSGRGRAGATAKLKAAA
jgi:uncharacterized iron-regulated membrane protein